MSKASLIAHDLIRSYGKNNRLEMLWKDLWQVEEVPKPCCNIEVPKPCCNNEKILGNLFSSAVEVTKRL